MCGPSSSARSRRRPSGVPPALLSSTRSGAGRPPAGGRHGSPFPSPFCSRTRIRTSGGARYGFGAFAGSGEGSFRTICLPAASRTRGCPCTRGCPGAGCGGMERECPLLLLACPARCRVRPGLCGNPPLWFRPHPGSRPGGRLSAQFLPQRYRWGCPQRPLTATRRFGFRSTPTFHRWPCRAVPPPALPLGVPPAPLEWCTSSARASSPGARGTARPTGHRPVVWRLPQEAPTQGRGELRDKPPPAEGPATGARGHPHPGTGHRRGDCATSHPREGPATGGRGAPP